MSARPRAVRVSVSALVAGSVTLGLFTGPAQDYPDDDHDWTRKR
ncbi:hypothetical protein [Streptomyces sp. NPDC127084]